MVETQEGIPMFFTAFLAVLVAALVGLVVKYSLSYAQIRNYYREIHAVSWREYGVVLLVMVVVIVPTVFGIGKNLSIDNIVTFWQFLNGVETQAVDKVTDCRAGHAGNDESAGQSNCDHTYVSGTYTYPETYLDEDCSYDSRGNRSCTTVTRCCRYPTANIYTPYATREHSFSIRSSFGFKENGPFTFAGVFLDAEPKPYGNKAIPGDIPRGAPADWLDAKAHLDAGDPRPVTALAKYPNFILASDDEVLKAYSADIARFQEARLLPDHTTGLMSDPVGGPSNSQAAKLSFVGVTVPDKQAWQEALMRFNAALGMRLQGDLHVVFVDTGRVSAQDAVPYTKALKAYWQGPAFRKRALAKNGVILVLGIANNLSIEWAQLTTGMPFGNELMAQYATDNLPGSDFSPLGLFGEPRTKITGEKAEVSLSFPRGSLEQIMFENAPFKRASMSCEDDGEDCVGFKDLLDTIEPTGTQKFWMVFVASVLATLLWLLVGFTSFVDAAIARARERFSW